LTTPSPFRFGPGSQLGVDEAMIHDVVHSFYGKIRRDPELGPIFEGAIAENEWDAHLAKMCDFWSSVLLMTGRFKGTPMAAHIALPAIRPDHFTRWLGLFRETVDEKCPPAAAALFLDKARTIAKSLELGIQVSRAGALKI
jgi:hemoglobin